MSANTKHYLPQRLAHLINLLAMILLIVTGFYIHRPYTEGLMGTFRYVHYVASFVLTLNAVWRIYYAFFGKHRDYREFKPELTKIPRVIKYYLYMEKGLVNSGKYNALQKLAYLGIPFLILYQALTGMAMGWPDGFMAGFIHAVGGLANVRALHYLGNWFFIVFTLIHVYLVFFEAPKQFWAMFFGKDVESKSNSAKQVSINVQSE